MAAQTITPEERRRATRVRSGSGPYPFVSEDQFDRRNRRHADLPLTDLASGLPARAVDYLADSMLSDAIRAMALTPLQARVLELRAAGVPVREIAERLGVGKWRIEGAIRRIRARFRARRHAPAEGWQEVYLSETRRAGR